jgi:hypothetical protein
MSTLLGYLKKQVPEASADIDEIVKYDNDETPDNQQGMPAHLEAIADKVENLQTKYPDKSAFFIGVAAVIRLEANPSQDGGRRRRRTNKRTRRSRKTRRM